MVARIVRLLRVFLGATLLAWASWQLAAGILAGGTIRGSRLGRAIGAHGERYELRVAPLSPDELAELREADTIRSAWTAWERSTGLRGLDG